MNGSQLLQIYLDKLTPLKKERWIFAGVLLTLFYLRILIIQRFFLITYCASIYLLHALIGFLTPKEESIPDPFEDQYDDINADNDYSISHNTDIIDDEFRPFMRRLPEYNFWLFTTKLLILSFFATFFDFCDVEVYAPVLVFYFIVMVIMTIRNMSKHMKKYKYNPFFIAKNVYKSNK